MALEELTLFGVWNKVDKAIDLLRFHEPPEGYYLAFSGGKDSQCIYHLAEEAGVKFDAHYRLTSVDPPELVQFIKKEYPQVLIDIPRYKDGTQITMWNLILRKKMLPTRAARYCCEKLKETGGKDRTCITGVRWAESSKRKNNRSEMEIQRNEKSEKMLFNDDGKGRMAYENCRLKGKRIVNPIVGWQEEDVWEYIHSRNLKYCKLYDEGYKRLGCIGCPLSPKQAKVELEKYSKYKRAYLRTFQKLIEICDYFRLGNLNTPEKIMEWWLYEGKDRKEIEGQLCLEDWWEDDWDE